jgi:phosphoribosylformylglycinamidine cyclo-ligase
MGDGEYRMDYQTAGVDLQEQEMFNVRLANKMPWLGGFAGAVDIGDDYLVSSCDGIGTKIQLWLDNRTEPGVSIKNLGKDLVAMVFNDIVCTGAIPLFMNDYLAVHNLNISDINYLDLIAGINEGLQEFPKPIPLVSGETAIMPAMMEKGKFDIAGFGVGAIPKDKFIDGTGIIEGDWMIGLASNGFHSNGYTLIREIWKNQKYRCERKEAEQLLLKLLRPTRIYVRPVLNLLEKHREGVKGIAHITGGGRDNVLRLLGEDINLRPKWKDNWAKPEEFKWIQEKGEVSDEEMKRVFNDGIGMIFIVKESFAVQIIETLTELGESPIICGKIASRLKQN